MSKGKELIGLLRKWGSGKPFDFERFIKEIDEIIWRVYNSRYGDLVILQKPYGKQDSRYKDQPEVLNLRLQDGSVMVDYDSFNNICWDHLVENNPLLRDDNLIQDKRHLRRYLQITFENLLQRKIYELTPGLETRKKQLDRVLKPHCLNTCRKLCHCWKLKDFKNKVRRPAKLKDLQKAGKSLSAPVVRKPKPGSKYGPSIKDEEMENYLVAVLRNAGGMTTCNDMLAFIKAQYSLETIKEIIQPASKGEEDINSEGMNDWIDRTRHNIGDYILPPEIIMMGKDLCAMLNPELREIYYHRIIKAKTLEKTARSTQSGTTTVHNKMNYIEKTFFSYFCESEHKPSQEEAEAVLQVISELISQEKEKSEKAS